MTLPSAKQLRRHALWTILAVGIGVCLGTILASILPPREEPTPDNRLAEALRSYSVLDLQASSSALQSGIPIGLRTNTEFQSDFDRLCQNLTPGAGYPLANLLKAWLAQHPEEALTALGSLTTSPPSFPLDLLVGDCGALHGELIWDHWQTDPAKLGARFAAGVGRFMEDSDMLASHEARFWSEILPGDGGEIFGEIVRETSSLSAALTLRDRLQVLPTAAAAEVYRALGYLYPNEVLAFTTADSTLRRELWRGLLEWRSEESYEAALKQAIAFDKAADGGTWLRMTVNMLWDRDEEALREAVESMDDPDGKTRLVKAHLAEAFQRAEPSEASALWENHKRLLGRRPMSEDELRKATGNNLLLTFPILATEFGERMSERGPALDYGERCSRSFGEKLTSIEDLWGDLRLGLAFSLHQGSLENLIAAYPTGSLGGRVNPAMAFVSDWVRIDPEEALDIASQFEDPEDRDGATQGIIPQIGGLLPDLAHDAFLTLEDGAGRKRTLEGWAYRLGEQNPHEGSKILAEIHREDPLPDEAIAFFVMTSASADVDGAMAWLDQITDPEIRERTLKYLGPLHVIPDDTD